MFKKRVVTAVFFFVSSLMFASIAFAEVVWSDANKVGLGGYDVVAYSTINAAVKGSKEHSTVFNHSTLYFASKQNLHTFKNDPYKYLPKYAGYCAFGVGKNQVKIIPNPNTFKIHNGKLHLFFNDKFEGKVVNTMTLWDSNEEKLSAQADKNWETLKH